MINTPATRKRKIFLSGIVQSLLANLRELGSGDELFRGDDAEVERIARDIGVSEHDLRTLAQLQSSGGQPSLLYRRLAALRLNLDDARIQSGILCDLQVHCAMCPDKKRCMAELAVRALDATWQDYCPNAYTLRALVAAKPVSDEVEDLIIYLNTIGGDANGEREQTTEFASSRRH